MTNELPQRSVTVALVAFAAVAVALTAYMHFTARAPLGVLHYAPALALTAVVVAWPFANGWRPFGASLRSCPACLAQWPHGEDGATTHCPACGT